MIPTNRFPASWKSSARCRVDLVQLNTLDRPGVVEWIRPSEPSNTRRFIAALEPFVAVEAVGPFRYRSKSARTESVTFHGDGKKDYGSGQPSSGDC